MTNIRNVPVRAGPPPYISWIDGSSSMDLAAIQTQLKAEGIDGWLLFDHHVRDPIAYRVLSLPAGHVSRRWYYWIPQQGTPFKLVHRIEPRRLDSLPGEKRIYASWQSQQQLLKEILTGVRTAAMQYSLNCMIPYVSLVDAGTVELVRSLGVEVVSSASLVQYFEARWDAAQFEMHLTAGRLVDHVRQEAISLIESRLKTQGITSEHEIAEFIRQRFRDHDLISTDGPIVGTNANSGDPHYNPSAEQHAPIRKGDFVLIDLWAKLNQPRSVYYDVTWTCFCGSQPTDEIQKVFEIVAGSRDAALEFVDQSMQQGRGIHGYQVDDVVRQFITDRGYGDAFVHRTGHSIGEEVHGNGANMDNLETKDTRPVLPQTCFSIEPGIYLPQFGVRSEINCYVEAHGARATGEIQREIVCMSL